MDGGNTEIPGLSRLDLIFSKFSLLGKSLMLVAETAVGAETPIGAAAPAAGLKSGILAACRLGKTRHHALPGGAPAPWGVVP